MPATCSRRRFLEAVVLATSAIVGSGCGTILYPERRGQPAGRLDWGIVALNGIGLILFFVPGVIAFAVDFATGAIYLPSDGYGDVGEPSPVLRRIDLPRNQLTRTGIARAVSSATGRTVSLAPDSFQFRSLDALESFWEVREELAAVDRAPARPLVMRGQSCDWPLIEQGPSE